MKLRTTANRTEIAFSVNRPLGDESRESNRLKYRSGSGSRNFLFLTVQFPFRFKTFQIFGFRFGSGSVAPKFKGSGSVRVHRNQTLKV